MIRRRQFVERILTASRLLDSAPIVGSPDALAGSSCHLIGGFSPQENLMPTCGRCEKRLESHDTITVADTGDRCYACFNKEMADRLGIDFDDTTLQSIVVADADGVPHSFRIRSMLVPTGHEMEAVEIPQPSRGGYRFAVLGDLEADSWDLFLRLYETMRQKMPIRHVERTAHGWHLGPEQRLVGRIEWDPDTDGRVPLLVVDGRPFTWEEVGRMLMTFEGFTIDARIEDTIELVGDRKWNEAAPDQQREDVHQRDRDRLVFLRVPAG